MAIETSLGLKKPELSDTVGTLVSDLGSNFDLIDADLAAHDAALAERVQNIGGVPEVQAGTLAARPAAADAPNRLYIVTDSTPPNAVYRSDGSAWGEVGRIKVLGAVRAYMNANQSLPAGAFAKLLFNTKAYDAEGDFDTVNNRYVARRSGVYRVQGAFQLDGTDDHAQLWLSVYKNGGRNTDLGGALGHSTQSRMIWGSVDVELLAGDYIELWGFHGSATARSTIRMDIEGFTRSHFSVAYLGVK